MKIFITSLPENNWWGNGTPQYADNPAMIEGTLPNQHILTQEWTQLKQTLTHSGVEVEVVPFPSILDGDDSANWKHDYVFFRDLYVTNLNGEAVLARFREKERQAEVEVVKGYLSEKNQLTIHQLPEDSECYMEGGELYYCPLEKILFAGESRNSKKGNELTADFLQTDELIVLKSKGFHLDTVFTPVLDSTGSLCACIVCMELMEAVSAKRLKDFCQQQIIELLTVHPDEAIGSNGVLGSFAVNCLPLPGILIGCAPFKNDAINAGLKNHGVQHVITPLTQFRLSGGSVHCLTNEL
ncbi:MAG: arginine deiminase-related protein [Candidatus Marinimicrobia bacterium]|nr:arginine deiminase-related protein [Candidatus Neomarinimicrobiota bacterium]